MTKKSPRILALFGSAVCFGAERGNIEVLAALRERGCEVLCLVRDEEWSTFIPAALEARKLPWNKVPYIEHLPSGRLLHMILLNCVKFLIANWKFFRAARRFKPTHIHAYGQLYVLNFLLGLALTRVPLVYRAGDVPTIHNLLWKATWRFIRWRTDRFVAISLFVAETLQNSGVDKKDITVIYNRPPQRVDALLEDIDYLRSSDHLTIGFIGQIIPEKGPHLLVESIRELIPSYPSLRLVIVGRVSDWAGDAWARDLKKRVLEDRILAEKTIFTGYIENVPAAISCCDLIVVPSLCEEAFSNVKLEAKVVGRPLIVFPNGGLPEMIEHRANGFVCNESTAAAITSALRWYLEHPEKIREHARASRASIGPVAAESFCSRWAEVYGIPISVQDQQASGGPN